MNLSEFFDACFHVFQVLDNTFSYENSIHTCTCINVLFVLAMLVLSFSLINRHLLQSIASAHCDIMCVLNIVTYQ